MNIALALIIDNNRILIGEVKPEKSSEYGGLPYVFPCHHVKDMLNAELELLEAVKTQSNLDVQIVRKIGERIHPSTKNHTYYYHCEKDQDQILTIGIETDFAKLIWVSINEIERYMPTLFDEVANYLQEHTN